MTNCKNSNYYANPGSCQNRTVTPTCSQTKGFYPDKFPLAMTYVPWQDWNKQYEFDRALRVGTIFPELDKPFTGRRNVPCR